MARNKNYDVYISNIKKEIEETEKKTFNLYAELEKAVKEKEQQDIDILHKYVKENNISFSDIIKTLNFNNNDETRKTLTKNDKKVAASRSSNSTKKITNPSTNKKPGRPKGSKNTNNK